MQAPPAPANDLSPWIAYERTYTCDCRCQSMLVMRLDDAHRVICAQCEKDHTDEIGARLRGTG